MIVEDEISQKRPQDEHVQANLSYIVEYETSLKRMINMNDGIDEVPNSYYKPFRFASEPAERMLSHDFFTSCDNAGLRKTFSVLIFLCYEITDLIDIADSKVFGPLSMFGQKPIKQYISSDETDEEFKSGEREIMMGKFLPALQEISNFVDRCYALCLNFVQQLTCLLSVKDQVYRSLIQKCHVVFLFERLSQLFVVLTTIDTIVANNQLLHECWNYYKTMITAVRADLSSYNTNESRMLVFDKLIVTINQGILSGDVLKNCVEQNFEASFDIMGNENVSEPIIVRNNKIFISELVHAITSIVDGAVSALNTASESGYDRLRIVGGLGLYALYRRVLPSNVQPESKIHKALWSVQKTLPFVVLHHNALWLLGDFMKNLTPYDLPKLDPPDHEAHRRAFLTQLDSSFGIKTAAFVTQVIHWLLMADSKITSSFRFDEENLVESLQTRMEIVVQGVKLANKGLNLAKTCLVAHVSMQVPLNKSLLSDIIKILETLKSIEGWYVRKQSAILEQQPHLLRMLGTVLARSLGAVRNKLTAERGRIDNTKTDLFSLLAILNNVVRGTDTYSNTRLDVIQFLCEIISGLGMFTDKDSLKMMPSVTLIKHLSTVLKDIQILTDTSFMYHHTQILPPIVDMIYSSSHSAVGANRMHMLFAVFANGGNCCEVVRHSDATPFLTNYREFLRQVVIRHVIQPLSKDIETDLRLHTHTKHLDHMHAVNPKTENLRPLRPFLEMEPIRILNIMVNIKSEVEHYLDVNFYNLTTVALHDWKTYADMKSLANEKLNLHLLNSFLPMGSLDQGLDILQIMRNIHIFVSRFTYNMNMQQFVEFRPDKSSKHLSTVRIQSIAASLRQHGLGILNTTVNYTYQFLSQKFHIFNQFLHDEYIRAHLAREFRWFKKHKNEADVHNMYPFERGLKFVKDIRKQGVFDGGKTCLDQFRVLITEIGNALGYVRMVRSASMYYCSEAVTFLPDIDNIINFEKFSGNTSDGANFSGETVRAAKNLDGVINTLVSNFGEGSDYFKILVNVFQSSLLTAENDHLKTFCMIVPSLCISWVENAIQAKDNMMKIVKGTPTKELHFTDDGFAMGIAYVLAILKQTKRNEALHWQDTIKDKHATDQKNLDVQLADRAARAQKAKEATLAKRRTSWFGTKKPEEVEENPEDEEEIHTLQMTGKKLETYKREYESLFYSMDGAGIFFKRTDVDT